MSTTKSYMNREAIEKIQELANDEVCLFCTHQNGAIVSRPMATLEVDAEGTIWFFSKKDSHKNEEIDRDHHVYLMYMNSGKQHYLSLSGYAEIVDDPEKAKALWTPIAKAWFEEGADDPDLSILKVTPDEGHYWDTKNGKLISLLKIAVSAITGKQSDVGIDGSIKI